MSTAKSRKKLVALQRQHAKLFERLLTVRPILRGTVSRVSTHCGKPNCWCARSPTGHAHVRMTWSQKGTMMTRKVPPAELTRVRTLTQHYRCFRSLRRQLLQLHTQIKQMLECYETELVEDSRKGMHSFGVRMKNAAHQTTRLQKTRKAANGNMS